MDFYEERDSVCDHIEERIDTTKTNSEIQRFYEGSSVLVTGATGLIGSLILEHLLRTCPKINKVYILLRPKKGKSPDERVDALFSSEVFRKVKVIHKDIKEKIVIIYGDLNLPYCGISEDDQNQMIENIDIIYHCAAALRMDEHIRTAYNMNVRATEDLLKLSTRMKKIKAFVYVSTAYTFPFLPDISEKFYETEFNAEQLGTLVSQLGDAELASLTPKIFGAWENSYSFTKAIAEGVIQKYSHIIPAVITRPSIVIGCEKEPYIGWINNMYGAVGATLAAFIGLVRIWYGDPDKIADIIPADKVASTLIAIGWYAGKNYANGKLLERPVFNIVSSTKYPQTWGEYNSHVEYHAKTYMYSTTKVLREYDFQQEKRLWLYNIKIWIYHIPFALLLDMVLKWKGKQPMLMRGFTKIHRFNLSLGFYATNEWVYNQDNVDKVWSEMTCLDKKIFNFTMENFDWKGLHSYTIKSINVYLLGDDFSNLDKSRSMYKRVMRIRQALQTVSACVFMYLIRGYLVVIPNTIKCLFE